MTKNVVSEYCWARNFWKNYSHIWNQHLWISLIAKYCELMKMPKSGPKNAWYGYFCSRILNKLLSYLKLAPPPPQIYLFPKFNEETKIHKFATKNTWFMYFWSGIWKQYCHFCNQHFRICLIANFAKQKILKFGTETAIFWYFLARTLEKCCHI